MKKLLLLAGILASASQLTLAQNNIGLGYGVTSKVYHSNSNQYLLPLVNLNYNGFFLKGDSAYGVSLGYELYRDENFAATVYGMPFGGYKIKGKNMKDGYKSIDTRKTQIMGGAELTYYPNIFNIVGSTSAEFGDKGGHFSFRLSRPYYLTSRLTLIPTASITYYTSEFIDYYFGIKKHELNNEKITNTYDGDNAYRYGAGLLANYKFNDSFSLTGFTGVNKFSKEIKNSPIVNKDVIFSFGTGIVYTF